LAVLDDVDDDGGQGPANAKMRRDDDNDADDDFVCITAGISVFHLFMFYLSLAMSEMI
jgi:hypothetical protein